MGDYGGIAKDLGKMYMGLTIAATVITGGIGYYIGSRIRDAEKLPTQEVANSCSNLVSVDRDNDGKPEMLFYQVDGMVLEYRLKE